MKQKRGILMRSLFDLEEANTILSALSDMDDFFLPKSVSRRDLYILVRKFTDAIGLKLKEDGELPFPNLFRDSFDTNRLVEVSLTQVDMDYVICALHAMNFEGTGYPVNINSAATRAYNKINAQFNEDLTDNPEIWEIVVGNNDRVDGEE
jgi:hypothetical protein